MPKVRLLIANLVLNFSFALSAPALRAQSTPNSLSSVSHSATLTFVQRDGTCMRGTITKADAISVTVEPFKQQPITLQRDNLLQVSQGNALLFSARSSWTDVVHTHLYPRESLVVGTKGGKKIKGKPVSVTADNITIKHALSTSVIAKSDVTSVDYLRLKPATDSFNLALEEAPWALVFYPEFYGRAVGLEGWLPVRLYDISKPEDDRVFGIKICP